MRHLSLRNHLLIDVSTVLVQQFPPEIFFLILKKIKIINPFGFLSSQNYVFNPSKTFAQRFKKYF